MSDIPPVAGIDVTATPGPGRYAPIGEEDDGLLEYEVLSGAESAPPPDLPGGIDTGEQT
jgi:hypothetical protein